MTKFEEQYQKLNDAQKKAVDTIDGPLMVVAGPGTGKTQLLSMRVANIMRLTDTPASNILCLTFTDNAARNMRERLESIIGQSAYHVGIHTFHSFGSDIISNYPDFFLERQLLQQVDELGVYELLRDIFEDLAYNNPLAVKVGDDFVMIKDTLTIISWLKQNALAPNELHQIINVNARFINKLSEPVTKALTVPASPKRLKTYEQLLKQIERFSTPKILHGFSDYGSELSADLASAISKTQKSDRYAPAITAWKNKWFERNTKGQYVFKDGGRNIRKLHALANVYQKLITRMGEFGLYDFDDMVIEAVHALETNKDLKYTLQERYQYILVDEFQDTNKAQFRMLQTLTDNPLFEGRPNIMSVGDDDQAIYSFQGAEVSNMALFTKTFVDTNIISLTDSYRLSPAVLKSSIKVVDQITDRLQNSLPAMTKQIRSVIEGKHAQVQHNSFVSELAQYEWIANRVGKYIKDNVQPEDIAILAPKHRFLERLIPYLAVRNIPVAYERRENILESPFVKQLISMSKLVMSIATNRQEDLDTYMSEVLSYEFWGIPNENLLDLSLTTYNLHKHWLPVMSTARYKKFRDIARWFTTLARKSRSQPLEYVLDELIGVVAEGLDSEYDEIATELKNLRFISPMRDYYFGKRQFDKHTDIYLSVLGQLSTLRQRIREWKPNKTLYIDDFVHFAELHEQAGLKIIDTNPHTQTTNAVQVMTAYKAKGLEFEKVFLINAQDEIWGPTARSRSLRISLPKNLPIVPSGDSDNDKLRLLFVAMTRAKDELIINSYTHDLSNRLSPNLSFISDIKGLQRKGFEKPTSVKSVEILSTDWAYRFKQVIADKPTLFKPRLAQYKLSVTHLNDFVDVVNGGPEFFLVHDLLKFPAALTPALAYGDSIHKTLQWISNQLKQAGSIPHTKEIQNYFVRALSNMHLKSTDFKKLSERGKKALSKYIRQRKHNFKTGDLIERGFNNEGAVAGGAILSGKIDKLYFPRPGQIEVIDFKTGRPAVSWQGKDEFEKIKLHKYRQQLLFYKLLVENSASFGKKSKVYGGALEFIESNDRGILVNNLTLDYTEQELLHFTNLIKVIWQHINDLNFPDVSSYKKNYSGIQKFEEDLISGKV